MWKLLFIATIAHACAVCAHGNDEPLSSFVFSMWEDSTFNALRKFDVLSMHISLAPAVHPEVVVRVALGPGGLLSSNHADTRKFWSDWRALEHWFDVPPDPLQF
jgi:hypothetical protein